jgi:hypothetical protein
MFYEFKSLTTGRMIEVNRPMSQAPALGEVIEVDGEKFERVVSMPQVNMQPSHWNYPVASRALPRKLEGCRHNEKGHTIIENKEHERSLCAKHDLRRADDF